MIVNAPTGISWQIIPFVKATSQQQLAEQTNMCWRATAMIDNYCNHVLRSTVDTERLFGPDYRVTQQQDTGNTRMIMQSWPVTEVLQVAVSPNSFPRSFQVVPSGYYEPEVPPITTYGTSSPSAAADGGQAIILSSGYVNWCLGRHGFAVSTSYLNGWPHAGTTVSASSNATELFVDDVTGMAGANVFIFDGAQTETATVVGATANSPYALPFGNATAQAGPGNITLSAGTAYAHTAGVVVSSMPQDVIWATILATVVQALESGVTAVTIQALPGAKTVGGQGIQQLTVEWETLLNYYRRTI
jgi:hypothetical protein